MITRTIYSKYIKLIQNQQLLEYQNKSMTALLHDYKRLIDEKDNFIIQLEGRNKGLTELIARLGNEMSNLHESVALICSNYGISANTDSNNMLDLLNKIFKNEYSLNEHGKIVTDSIVPNVTNLINTLCGLVKEVNSGNYGETQIAKENSSLKESNSELTKRMAAMTDERNDILIRAEIAEANVARLEADIKDKNDYIESLNDRIKTLTVKVKSHPILPYIFYSFEKIGEHECICHICESGMKKDILIAGRSDEELNDLNATERESLLNMEVEELRKNNSILLDKIEQLKFDYIVTDEKILNSKPFQYLLSQADMMVKEIENLNMLNLDLQKTRNEALKDKDNEMRNYETRLIEVIDKLEARIIELTRENENLKISYQEQDLRIKNIQNLLSAKETVDISKLCNEFEEDKKNLLKDKEQLRLKTLEQEAIIEDYKNQIDEIERKEFKCRQEVDKYKIRLSGYEQLNIQDGSLVVKYDKFDIREREEMKRSIASKKEAIVKHEAKIKSLKAEIQAKDEANERLINDMVLNEQGLEELNKKNKEQLICIQDNTEKIAKMTNEKSKDLHTIKLLNEVKEILDKRLRDQEDMIQTLMEINKKNEYDISVMKDIKIKEEQEMKLKNDELESLKKRYIDIHKNNEELRNKYDEINNALKVSQANSSKHLVQYEQLKTKYENLCKYRNIVNEGKTMTYDELLKENNTLTLENDSYRVFLINLGNSKMQSLQDKK
jgi:hypothetical protein